MPKIQSWMWVWLITRHWKDLLRLCIVKTGNSHSIQKNLLLPTINGVVNTVWYDKMLLNVVSSGAAIKKAL